MLSPAVQLARLLDEEREAAKAANLERLVELQEAKRAAVESLGAIPPSDEEHSALAIAARENLVLIRHLASMYRALAGGGVAVTYGAAGQRVETGDLKHERGHL